MSGHRVMGILVLILGILLAGSLTATQAANYLGDFCWQTTDGGVGKLAVTDMGGGHFLLNGKSVKPGGILDSVVNGNAEIVGSYIYMVLTSAGGDAGGTWGGFNWVVLNLATLNGSVEYLGVDHSKTNPNPSNVQTGYDSAQALTFITCP